MDVFAARGVAVREFQINSGPTGYPLFVDRNVGGVVEATLRKISRSLIGYMAEQL
jgi:hypothetical protein